MECEAAWCKGATLESLHGGGESGQIKQAVFDLNADEPPGLVPLAVDRFAKEKIVVVLDFQKRGGWQRLVEPDLGAAFTDVSNHALEHLTERSSYAHDGGVTDLSALGLSLIRVRIKSSIE
jgi:hypothetical protein